MVLRDIQDFIESWAPKEIAWEHDNVGLQIGDSRRRVSRILVALDVSESIIKEAAQKKIDLLISHHPLLFRPLRSITYSERIGGLVQQLVEKNIAVYSAHTNLDFTRGGVSFALAESLELKEVDFLEKIKGLLKKIAVFVPTDYVDKVTEAMAHAGAGTIGNYELCSFRTSGTGTFKPMEKAKPFKGSVGKLEKTGETRLEMIVPSWRVSDVIKGMIQTHPYEEVAYDVYPLENRDQNYGVGALGELERPMSLQRFLSVVKKNLATKAIRYTGKINSKIKRVAVCGGSGSDLLPTAINLGADAFVTADVKYHAFQKAEGRIALIDAGHYETEFPIIYTVGQRLKEFVRQRKETVQVFTATRSTNPIMYY